MGYIGSQPATNFETVRKQVSTTNSGTTITLDFAVSSVQDILVTVNAVVQSYDNYSVSGTTLTLGGTLNNDRVEILYVGRTFQTVSPAVGTVTNDMLAGSIVNSKLANSSITLNGSAVSLGGSATISSNAGTEIVYADRSGNQTLSDNTWTKIEYNTEQYDPDSNWDTTNDRYIAPSAGRYYFTATAYLWGSLQNVHSQFYLNGSNVGDTYFIINYNASNTTHECSVRSNAILNLSASDYVEFYAKSDVHSGSVTVDQLGTQFLAFRLD